MIADILSDDTARAPSFGRGAAGLNVPGVKTGTKTGTSNLGTKSKDLWMMSFSPRAVASIWVGNHVPQPMNNALSSIVGPTMNKIMGPLHKDIFQPDGTWKTGDWFQKPAGIQTLNVQGRTDIFPSWYNKNQIGAKETVVFDKFSKKKATECTPDSAKVEVSLQKITDPITKQTSYISFDGYDASATDDLHKCDDVKPFVTDIKIKKQGNSYTVTASVTQGTHGLQTAAIAVDGESQTVPAAETGDVNITYTPSSSGQKTITVTITDAAGYTGTMSRNLAFIASGGGNSGNN
jgi:penicillin-binding protein 1A